MTAARPVFASLVAAFSLLAGCAAPNPKMTEELRYMQEYDCSSALVYALGSANRGEASGQYNMGFLWQRGCGVPRHYRNAYDWYVLAAGSGEPRAMLALGEMHLAGQSVEPDNDKAAKWFELAARYGNVEAGAKLTSLGRSVPAPDLANYKPPPPPKAPRSSSSSQSNQNPPSTGSKGSSWLKDLALVLFFGAAAYYGSQPAPTVVYREVDVPRYYPPQPTRFQTTCVMSAFSSTATVNCN